MYSIPRNPSCFNSYSQFGWSIGTFTDINGAGAITGNIIAYCMGAGRLGIIAKEEGRGLTSTSAQGKGEVCPKSGLLIKIAAHVGGIFVLVIVNG